MGLSIVGGIDQACPPFGIEQRGVFVSKVSPNSQCTAERFISFSFVILLSDSSERVRVSNEPSYR